VAWTGSENLLATASGAESVAAGDKWVHPAEREEATRSKGEMQGGEALITFNFIKICGPWTGIFP